MVDHSDVFIDATGVGQLIVDILSDNSPAAWRLWAVYFTHGDRRNEDRDARRVTLGKAHLLSRLQTLWQFQRLHLPDTSEARALARISQCAVASRRFSYGLKSHPAPGRSSR